MEQLLSNARSQAVTLVVRSGITLAGSYALGTLSKFLSRLPENERADFERIKDRIQTKIQIISPAIDLIELIAARGNNSLVSTLQLTRELKTDIEEFHEKMELAENEKSMKTAIAHVQSYTTDLLSRIEEAIPLINLALTTSGANLSSGLPDPVSPGRLLQAAKLLNSADESYQSQKPYQSVQVGPNFQLTVYSVYYATAHTDAGLGGGASIAWKEDYVKCTARLFRVNDEDRARKNSRTGSGQSGKYGRADSGKSSRVSSGQSASRDNSSSPTMTYSYKLKLEENFNDGRYHDAKEEKPRTSEIDVSCVSRLFFSASGHLLEIEESNSPVLVLKVNKEYNQLLSQVVSRKGVIEEKSVDEFYRDIDSHVEWLAFEAYEEDESDEEEEEEEEEEETEDQLDGESTSSTDNIVDAMESMSLNESNASLSLLEYLIRLSALQANDQQSLYTIQDERIALYLKDENQTSDNQTSSTASHTSESPRSSPSYREGTPPSGKRRTSARYKQSKAQSSPSPLIPHSAPRTPLKKASSDQSNGETTPLTPWEQDKMMRSGLRNMVLRQAAMNESKGSPADRGKRN